MLAEAAAEGPEPLLAALEAEAEAIWTAPHRRRADVLGPEDLADARVATALRGAASELRGLAREDPELLGTPHELLEALAAVEVREPSAIAGAEPAGAPAPGARPAGVLLAQPLEIRARRFRAVFVCGLQDGEFPGRPQPDPFLSDDDRRGLMAAAGLRLPLHEDVLDRERSLFYSAVSRPEDVLFLSWRSSDEEGDPQAPSAFLDDVRALFTEDLWEERGTRLLADVTWAPRDAPTPHELRRAYAAAQELPEPAPLGAPRSAAALGLLAGARHRAGARPGGVRRVRRRAGSSSSCCARTGPSRIRSRCSAARSRTPCWSARWSCCASGPARRGSRPSASRPRSAAWPTRWPSGRAAAPRRARARCCAAWRPTSSATCARRPSAARATSRRCSSGRSAASRTPTARCRSATARARSPAASTASTSGRTARRSCATTSTGSSTAAPSGRDELQLQVALYLLAVRELLDLEPVAGLYQPLFGRKLGARGLVRDDVPGRYTRTDLVDEAAFGAALEAARALAARTAADLHAGRLAPCPERCSSRGCRYPGICRGGEPTREVPA